MRRLTAIAIILAGLLTAAAPTPAAGQAPSGQPRPQVGGRATLTVAATDEQRADDTRRQFQDLLKGYPPALGRVLKLDPTLMSSAPYLTSYPALAAFLQRHPEVARSPSYFLGFVNDYGETYNPEPPLDANAQIKRQTIGVWENVLAGTAVLTGGLMFLLTFSWLVRFIVGHRRWLRATKIQSEVHNRLLERFSSNEDLLSYVQSPAGRHFLQAVPVTADSVNAPSLAAPFGRILWSIQAGLVLAAAGIGLLIIKHYVIEEVGGMMLVFGVLGIALGVGFALAAGASYILSQRLGLFDAAKRPGDADRA